MEYLHYALQYHIHDTHVIIRNYIKHKEINEKLFMKSHTDEHLARKYYYLFKRKQQH